MNGNVIVGQSGGPTSVINSSLVGVFQGAKRAGCGKIYGMRNGLEGLLQERYVELNDCIKNDLDIEILKRVSPTSVFKADWLNALCDVVCVNTGVITDFLCFFY